MANTVISHPPLRVVLDTNVLLSLWAFVDSRLVPLRHQVECGAWTALANKASLAEYRRVLNYPKLKLDAATQRQAYDRYLDVVQHVGESSAQLRPPLPRCQDRDDQKFLELARDGRADWLLTADKDLLKLARRDCLSGMFRIATPDVALASLMSTSSILVTINLQRQINTDSICMRDCA